MTGDLFPTQALDFRSELVVVYHAEPERLFVQFDCLVSGKRLRRKRIAKPAGISDFCIADMTIFPVPIASATVLVKLVFVNVTHLNSLFRYGW